MCICVAFFVVGVFWGGLGIWGFGGLGFVGVSRLLSPLDLCLASPTQEVAFCDHWVSWDLFLLFRFGGGETHGFPQV